MMRSRIILNCGRAALAMCALIVTGVTARADALCPNAGVQGGFNNSFTNFSGTLDGTCGTNSGVTLSIPVDDAAYAKLTWTPSAGLNLGNFSGLTASVSFTADQASDGPYFQLAFIDPTNSLGQASATDQILAIAFGDVTIPQDDLFHTTVFDPNSTLVHLYDNTTGTDLQGGISGAMTLTTFLSGVLAADAGQHVDEIRFAIGLAGGCGAGPCTETLAVDSVELTPEPGSVLLALTGLAGLLVFRRLSRPERQ